MLPLLWLIPTLPLAGFVALTLLSGARPSRRTIALIGVGSIGLSALVTLLVGSSFLLAPPPDHAYTQTFWTWIGVGDFQPQIAFSLDALSLLMTAVVTFVGFLIHLYSAEFMADSSMTDDNGYGRFFAYMNLFVGMMLILVLADNLLLLYLGWEGVGLCSFLLIGFWYHDPQNGRAARKAFIVTRIGDTAMAIGLFLLFDNLGTLQIQPLMQRAAQQWPVGSTLAVAAAALLLGGAVGKSAQLPLQIWLPDAMAGPTPVSALLHAATMVTAGVYLIARTHVLFSLAPAVMLVVAVIGALTLLLAGFSALVQEDIKRVLAYSTMSQVGYMFLALGVGAWSAAMFHFMTHAFFKALLFLGAGVIISRLHHEHSMFKMGGLRRELPLTFWTFLIGAASLSALPLVTAGFYSKDKILWDTWSSAQGGPWLWAAGLFGALLTAIYTFRMVFLTFFGEPQAMVREHAPLPQPGWRMSLPLVVLAALSVVGGLVETPDTLGGINLFSRFIETTLPPRQTAVSNSTTELIFQLLASALALGGVYVAYLFFLRRREWAAQVRETAVGRSLHHFWRVGWGFDWLDNELIVRPIVRLARLDKNDVIDSFYDGLAQANLWLFRRLNGTENGQVRRYAAAIALGAFVMTTLVVILL